MSERLTVLAFRAAWALLPRTPERVSRRLFDLLSDLGWLHNGADVRRLQSNLARVSGLQGQPLRDLTRRAMRSYGRYWREMFSLPGWSQAQFDGRVRVVGREHLDAALASGRGAVLAATHSGNWDMAGVWCARRYGQATTVAERVKPEALFDAFVAARSRYGIEIIPHRGGPKPPFAVLLERLRAGGLVGLVCDRDLSRHGVDVEFFGATARMAGGPAALARASGATLIPVAVWNDGPTCIIEFHAPITIDTHDSTESVTQRIADVFAADLARHPEDWHMLQTVWPRMGERG